MIKFEIKFRAADLIGGNGKPFCPVINSKLFYMTPEEFTKLQDIVAKRDDMVIEVLPCTPTSADAAVRQVEQLIGKPVKNVHAYA